MNPAVATDAIEDTRGDQWRWPVRLTSTDSPSAVDLTGMTITATLKWRNNGELACTITDRDNSAGSFTVEVSEADNVVVPMGRVAKLILKVVDSLGDVQTYCIVPVKVIAP